MSIMDKKVENGRKNNNDDDNKTYRRSRNDRIMLQDKLYKSPIGHHQGQRTPRTTQNERGRERDHPPRGTIPVPSPQSPPKPRGQLPHWPANPKHRYLTIWETFLETCDVHGQMWSCIAVAWVCGGGAGGLRLSSGPWFWRGLWWRGYEAVTNPPAFIIK